MYLEEQNKRDIVMGNPSSVGRVYVFIVCLCSCLTYDLYYPKVECLLQLLSIYNFERPEY